jgi:hypothetical protein
MVHSGDGRHRHGAINRPAIGASERARAKNEFLIAGLALDQGQEDYAPLTIRNIVLHGTVLAAELPIRPVY